MSQKISFINQKGGVGKTRLTLHASGVLSELNKKVLTIDLDPQGNLSTAFLSDISALKLTLADVLREEDNRSITEIIQKTSYPNIDIVPANRKLM